MNSNIAMGIRPVQIPDQGESYQRALTMAALLGQNELQGIHLQEGQRSLRQNQLMDEAAQGSTSMDDYLSRLDRINPPAAIKLRHELLGTTKTRGEVTEQQSKSAQGLTSGFMSVPDAQKAQVYPQFAAEWKRQQLPNHDTMPAQFSPDLIPRLTMIANSGLTSEQAATRADYAAAGQPPTTMANHLAQPAAMPVMSQDITETPLPADRSAMSAGQENAAYDQRTTLAPQEVNAKAPFTTPDEMRQRAAAARAKGTKAGAEIAKDLEGSANQLESRILQEQGLEQQKVTAAENIRVREEGIKVRQQNQGQNARNNASKLADDFRQEPAVKDYRTVQPLIASMENASKAKTAASDLDMVYAIAKIFDPGSVVREGEQIMVVNAGGLPSRLQSVIGFMNGGQRLSQTLRDELLDQAHSRADNYKQAYDSASQSYRDQATRWELNPDDIVRDYKVTSKGIPQRRAGDIDVKAAPQGSITGKPLDSVEVKPRNEAPISGAPLTATNPKTKQRIISHDGGKTWQAQ